MMFQLLQLRQVTAARQLDLPYSSVGQVAKLSGMT